MNPPKTKGIVTFYSQDNTTPNIPEMDVMWSVTDDLLAAVNKRGEDVQTACDAHQKEALEQISAMQ